jgi:hypothetical protein
MASALSASAAATSLPLRFQKGEFLNNFVINLKASCTSNRTSVEGRAGSFWQVPRASSLAFPLFPFHQVGASNSLLMAAHFTVQRVC